MMVVQLKLLSIKKHTFGFTSSYVQTQHTTNTSPFIRVRNEDGPFSNHNIVVTESDDRFVSET